MLIELRLQQRKRTQERDRWIGRAIGGAVGGLATDGLNQLSDRELEQLGLRRSLHLAELRHEAYAKANQSRR